MKIQEVSQRFNLSSDTLRYYEKIGIIDPVEKRNGIRHYREQDLERINFIQCMKPSGMTLETIGIYFKLYEAGDHTAQERLDLLYKQKEIAEIKLQELQQAIEYIDYKIDITTKRLKGEH